MSEYLKDLETVKPGDKLPPINLGPFDNPLLWNLLDPFGADRGHQRRPMSVSRSTMELHDVPLVLRDQCVHRWFAFDKCLKNLKPVTFGQLNCHEAEESWIVCRAFETYRYELLKVKFMQMTKDYTNDDKRFFPSAMYMMFPTYLTGPFKQMIAAMRTSGFDESDPRNPLMNREPNRALMRSEFSPTNFERETVFERMNSRRISQETVHDQVPSFPLPDSRRPYGVSA